MDTKPVKIILVGAQSTGKTSVMNALRPELRDISIREVIRTMTAEDPSIRINQNGNDISQDRFFYEYMYLFAKYPTYISDRGLLDVCAYTKWLSQMGKVSESTYEKQMILLKDWVNNNPSAIHIYFPIYFPVVDDGYRDTNEENRKAVDQCIQDVIDELIKEQTHGFSYVTIKNAPISERVKNIEELYNILRASF